MKNVVWFLIGVISGFVFAHLVNKDPRGHEILGEVDARIGEFTDRIGDAYREQEARFAGVIDAARDAAAEVVDSATGAIETAKTAAGEAFATAKDVASDAVDAVQDAASDARDAAESGSKPTD
jgi:methyl-accepting chemotaxis protein